MIIISIISIIISFLIQNILSNNLVFNFQDMSILYTFCPMLTLNILLPYFENKKKYIILLIITGLIIDITYTNTLILNTLIIFVIYIFNNFFTKTLPYNLLMINISNVISIIIYHTITYIVLTTISYEKYKFFLLFKAIFHSIIMTIILTSIIYIVIKKINKNLTIKEVR